MANDSLPRLSPAQLRAARGWLNLSQRDLAQTCAVNVKTIAEFERGASVPYDRTLRDIQRALEEFGVELLFEGGVAVGMRCAPRSEMQAVGSTLTP